MYMKVEDKNRHKEICLRYVKYINNMPKKRYTYASMYYSASRIELIRRTWYQRIFYHPTAKFKVVRKLLCYDNDCLTTHCGQALYHMSYKTICELFAGPLTVEELDFNMACEGY
jgi:hypothetical protein